MKARYWVGGCLSAIVLLAVIAGAAYYFLLQASDELVDTYTSPEPRDFARVEEGRDEVLSVIDRFQGLRHCPRAGRGDRKLLAVGGRHQCPPGV